MSVNPDVLAELERQWAEAHGDNHPVLTWTESERFVDVLVAVLAVLIAVIVVAQVVMWVRR